MEISATMDHLSNSSSTAPPGNQDQSMAGHDEAEENMLRFSPTSPFVTMRHYISEFDPNEAVTNMSMNALKLLDSWKAYVNTFIELCDVQKVSVENRRKLLLVLGGSKLRLLLDQLEANAESKSQSLEDTVRVITHHFESRKAVQMARYHFFYSPQNKQRPGESVNDWTSRLITMSEKCQFSKSVSEGMTVNDALTVVMYKQSVEDHNKRSEIQAKPNSKNGPTEGRKCKGEADENDEHALPVDVQWGEGDESDHHQNHVMKVDPSDPSQIQQPQLVHLNSFIYATRAPAVGSQQQSQQQTQQQQPQVLSIRLPTEPNFSVANNSVQQINDANLTHSDMDLLRRARGGPCICPNCTLFPKRRAGKHNCHIPGCGREYAKTSHLRAHLVSHCNVLPFACSWVGCNKRFYRTDQLTRHARIHTGEKKFTCGVCDHAFSRSDHLAKHVRRHTNVANGGSAGNQNQSNPNQQPTKITIAHTTPMQAVGQGTSAVLANSPISQQGPQNIVTSTSNNLAAAAAAAAAAAHNQQHMLSMSGLPYMQMPPKNTPHIFYH